MINNKPTYISLFSSAGVGCYGFKLEGYDCIATNELIKRRIDIQRLNQKCIFETGYINKDITQDDTKLDILNEVNKWKEMGNDFVDVIIATPPCQGMSVANRKQNPTNFTKNSLVVESIQLIKSIEPNFFVFENVPAFMKTLCAAPCGTPETISKVIKDELGDIYTYEDKTLNFKDYGSNSSRRRTLVIGVHKRIQDVFPQDLFPDIQKEKTLKETIGHLPSLSWGEFDKNDFYHQFRTYKKEMFDWVHNTPMGKSAFDNPNPMHRPHQIINGKYVLNTNKLSSKYTRQHWNNVGPCIHTRNDQMASQNTIHPQDDRVFSIRELMILMTIPDSFKWIDMDIDELNKLSYEEKIKILKKHEINIRQSIGEAVPTIILQQIAHKIKNNLIEERK